MTSCKLVPFELGDLEYFIPFQEYPNLIETMIDNQSNPYRTLLSFVDVKGQVHAICGINFIRTGTVEVWSLRGIEYKDHSFEYFKNLKRYIHNGILSENTGINRVEIAIRHDEPDFFKWAEKLGGVFECVAKKYAANIDHHVYIVLRED